MRTFLWFLLLIVAGAIGYAFWSGAISLGVQAGVCRHDDEIDSSLRSNVEAAAKVFLANIAMNDAKAAYAQLSQDVRKEVSLDGFVGIVGNLAKLELANAKLQSIYAPTTVGSTSSAICRVSGPDGMVSVAALPHVTQLHLLYAVKTQNNDWAVTLWLVQNGTEWEVRSFFANVSSIAGHFARDLMRLAKEQDAKGHPFNAHMLLFGASGTTNRGRDLSLGIAHEALSALRAHEPPPDLKGVPPFKWRLDGKVYSVESVQIMGVGGQLALVFMHRDEEWDDSNEEDAERRNRAFLDNFVHAHPEYKEVFGFLVARIGRPSGNKLWGTVLDAKTGYLPTKAKPARDGK